MVEATSGAVRTTEDRKKIIMETEICYDSQGTILAIFIVHFIVF